MSLSPTAIFHFLLRKVFETCQVYYTVLRRERRQLGFVTLNGNLAVSGWVGLTYDR